MGGVLLACAGLKSPIDLTSVGVLGAFLGLGFLAGVRTGPSAALTRVVREMAGLRADIDGYRTAQEHLAASLERRMDDLERTTALAANEVRMASSAVMGDLPTGSAGHR